MNLILRPSVGERLRHTSAGVSVGLTLSNLGTLRTNAFNTPSKGVTVDHVPMKDTMLPQAVP